MRACEFITEAILAAKISKNFTPASDPSYLPENPTQSEGLATLYNRGKDFVKYLGRNANQHKIPDFSVPIIPDNMPFGKNFGGGGGTFKGGGISTPPPTSTKAPPIENRVVPAMVGRPKPEDVTHAYRTMQPEELQHAQSTGHFTAKDPNRENIKWWTAHTAEPKGIGGLEKSTEPYPGTNVRVPIHKVPSDTAVNANHAEFWNRETGAWTPVISGVPAP